jgi:uncharacterized protein with HEPN domain
MNEVDREWLTDMLEYSRKAVRHLETHDAKTLVTDDKALLAVSHAIQVVGEAANHVSEEGRRALHDIPWNDVIGMRHRLVHGYRTGSTQVIVDTVKEHLPRLILILVRALGDEPA